MLGYLATTVFLVTGIAVAWMSTAVLFEMNERVKILTVSTEDIGTLCQQSLGMTSLGHISKRGE